MKAAAGLIRARLQRAGVRDVGSSPARRSTTENSPDGLAPGSGGVLVTETRDDARVLAAQLEHGPILVNLWRR